jgi:hypothetical protein
LLEQDLISILKLNPTFLKLGCCVEQATEEGGPVMVNEYNK